MNMLPILAVVGLPCAGKGVVVGFFEKFGYHSVVTGEILREELRELGVSTPNRDQQGEHGRSRRAEFGPGYFADLGMSRVPAPHLIEGSRSPSEVDDLLGRLGAIVVGLSAQFERRFHYAQGRGSERDPVTLEAFYEMDQGDRGYIMNTAGTWVKSGDPNVRDADYALSRAHAIVHNNCDVSDLVEALRDCWEDIQTNCVGPGLPVRSYGTL